MAAVAAAARLTENHRLAQARLGADTVRAMLTLWRLIDPNSLDATAPAWLRSIEPLIARQWGRSVDLATSYFQAFRALELGVVEPIGIAAPTLDWQPVATSLSVTGPIAVKTQISRGVPLADALERAAASSARAALRHSLNGGRTAIVETARTDPKALGWARATSGRPCAFCALLAGRGAVYFSDESADFQPHDGCSCTPEPVYRRDAPLPGDGDRWAALYAEQAKGSSDPLNAFRRAFQAEMA